MNDKLITIGVKVNDAIRAVWDKGPTVKELESLEKYLNHQETLIPLVDPTFIVTHGFKFFNQAKERIRLLKAILALKELEAAGK